MNLADARSYFSDGFAEACRDKTFVDEQIQAHADEPTYIRDAIRELGWYGELLNETKAKLGKEPGLAQRTALEYLWNHSAGPVSWGSLALWIRRQHPRGASRSIRAVEKLEDAGVISVKHRGWGGTSQPIVDVKLNSELLPAHRLVEHARAIRLEHPEVEAEIAVADEVAGRGAHERPADAATLVRLEHVERVDLRLESLDGLACGAAARESDEAFARTLGDPGLGHAARGDEALSPGGFGFAARFASDHVEREDARVGRAPGFLVHARERCRIERRRRADQRACGERLFRQDL